MRGSGITEIEVDFIKAKIIEVAKRSQNTETNAQLLNFVISGGLGNHWAVFIFDTQSKCNLGLKVADPLFDKWIQIDSFGPHGWFYAIWLDRN